MRNFALSFNAVAPLFFIVMIGYWIRGRKMVDEHSLAEFNHVSYYLFISVNLFFSIYQSDLSAAANWSLVGFCIIGVILECIVGMLFIPCIEPDPASAGAMMQSMFRTNLVLVGLPIAAGLYENELGAISIVTAILVPFYNVLGVFFLERYRSGSASVRKIAKGIITNPLVIAAVLGIAFSINGWRLPYAAEKTVRYFSQGCTAVALFILGASLNFGAPGNSHRRKDLIVCLVLRLLIFPILSVTIAILMGFRGAELVAILAVFGCPLGTVTYAIAQQMDSDSELAGELVFFSTVVSCLTLFLQIFTLKELTYI